MRYLKTFESILSKDIKKFCEDNLAYLVDIGFSIDISEDRHYDNAYSIYITNKDNSFKWDDIKYDFIPFFELLNLKHHILRIDNNNDEYGDIKLTSNNYNPYFLNKKEIFNDELNKISWVDYKIRTKKRISEETRIENNELYLSSFIWRSIDILIRK
jgi:hypothetical protein